MWMVLSPSWCISWLPCLLLKYCRRSLCHSLANKKKLARKQQCIEMQLKCSLLHYSLQSEPHGYCNHSVRPPRQTLAVTSPLDADTRKGTYTQARDWFLRTTPLALPGRQNCAVDQYLHLFFFKLASHLHAKKIISSEPTIRAAWIWQSQSVRPQALSATSQMDADTRNGRHTHEGACVAAHFVSNAQK